jgi:hypothetical protein
MLLKGIKPFVKQLRLDAEGLAKRKRVIRLKKIFVPNAINHPQFLWITLWVSDRCGIYTPRRSGHIDGLRKN